MIQHILQKLSRSRPTTNNKLVTWITPFSQSIKLNF